MGWFRVQRLQEESNPTSATIGLRIEPGEPGSGLTFKLAVQARVMPLHIYKNTGNFTEHMTHYIQDTLECGPRGLQVTDCIVTMTDCDYYVADCLGKPISDTPKTTAADIRKLTPLIVHSALQQAGTLLCEPVCRFMLTIPSEAFAQVMPVLAKLDAITRSTEFRHEMYVLKGDIPARKVLRLRLPDLTGGEGVLESVFDRYEPVRGNQSTRSDNIP